MRTETRPGAGLAGGGRGPGGSSGRPWPLGPLGGRRRPGASRSAAFVRRGTPPGRGGSAFRGLRPPRGFAARPGLPPSRAAPPGGAAAVRGAGSWARLGRAARGTWCCAVLPPPLPGDVSGWGGPASSVSLRKGNGLGSGCSVCAGRQLVGRGWGCW